MAEISVRGETLTIRAGVIATLEICGHSFKARKEDLKLMESFAIMDQKELSDYQIHYDFHCPVCAEIAAAEDKRGREVFDLAIEVINETEINDGELEIDIKGFLTDEMVESYHNRFGGPRAVR